MKSTFKFCLAIIASVTFFLSSCTEVAEKTCFATKEDSVKFAKAVAAQYPEVCSKTSSKNPTDPPPPDCIAQSESDPVNYPHRVVPTAANTMRSAFRSKFGNTSIDHSVSYPINDLITYLTCMRDNNGSQFARVFFGVGADLKPRSLIYGTVGKTSSIASQDAFDMGEPSPYLEPKVP